MDSFSFGCSHSTQQDQSKLTHYPLTVVTYHPNERGYFSVIYFLDRGSLNTGLVCRIGGLASQKGKRGPRSFRARVSRSANPSFSAAKKLAPVSSHKSLSCDDVREKLRSGYQVRFGSRKFV